MTGAQGEQNTLHLGAARWRPESRYSVGEVGREKWGKREVMLGCRSQPASFSSPAIKLNPPWSPHQSWWLLLAPEKDDGVKGGRKLKERQKCEWEQKIIDVCLFHIQNWGAVAKDNQWLLCIPEFFSSCSPWYCYYGQSNLALKSHQNINNYVKYQPAGSLTRRLTIPILLRQSIENLTLVLPTVCINSRH